MISDGHPLINCYKCVHLLHTQTETNVMSAGGKKTKQKKTVSGLESMFFFPHISIFIAAHSRLLHVQSNVRALTNLLPAVFTL